MLIYFHKKGEKKKYRLVALLSGKFTGSRYVLKNKGDKGCFVIKDTALATRCVVCFSNLVVIRHTSTFV